ncbi:hypothetical protein JYB87_12655 [Shewanella avicenniae]|uniref:Uncharacterized protein n=1 Tax=Shewanella avicenniae TaxID=2814294 RepID=A0ABX7QNK6_9GAMM|nr:hypothetical protein [Shewanella avicenniae]QSX32602.1 hypothetical protein JYB87_12655 [Shewanella avicenniae]
MTNHAATLLSYLSKRLPLKSKNPAERRANAERWLDEHCAGWRDHQTPEAKHSVLIVSKADEDEEE